MSIMSEWITYSLFLILFCFFKALDSYNYRNTICCKRSLFSSLAFSIGVLILAMFSLCLCAILQKHIVIFQYSQMIGIAYLMYIGVSIMTKYKNRQNISNSSGQMEDNYNITINTALNAKNTTVMIAIITQFYKNINHWYILILLLFSTILIAFSAYSTTIFGSKYLQKYEKNINFIYKLLGFAIILLSVSSIKKTIS